MEKRKKYSKELKLQAVKTFLKGEKSCSVIAKDLDVSSRKRIIEWVSIYRKKGAGGFNPKPRNPAGRNKGRVKKNFVDEKEELEYLRAKVDLLEKIISFNVKKK
ncbi:MAG: transposase [Candidatus Delongbacteria bacterium]|nr:transposase [Candidatus Delongbacteria bacterium]